MGFLLFPPPPPPPRNKYIKNGEGVKFILKNISAPRSPFPPFVSLRAFPQFSSLRPKSDRNWNCCLSTPPPTSPPTTFYPFVPGRPPLLPPPLPKTRRPIELPSFLPSLLVLGSNEEDLGFAGRGAGVAMGAALFLQLRGRKWGGKNGAKKGRIRSLPSPRVP